MAVLSAETAKVQDGLRSLGASSDKRKDLPDVATTGTRALAGLRDMVPGVGDNLDTLTTVHLPELKDVFAALDLGGLVAGVIKAVGDTSRDLTILQNTASATGFKPGDLKAVQETFEKAGGAADTAETVLIKVSDLMGRTRLEAIKLSGALQGDVEVLRGGILPAASQAARGVEVFRGSMAETRALWAME